tara:strand:- start:41 stop:622 length:582 start_codon:yes stop_codon:yes gene_type:complete
MAGLMDILNFVKARIGDNEVEEASEKIYYNNPGNIEAGQGYAGETGEIYADRFSIFGTPQMGVRSVFRDVGTKTKRHKGDLKKIINQYAPPNENDTENYYNFVREQIGSDTVTSDNMADVVRAIIIMENTPEMQEYYLTDPSIMEEAEALSGLDLPSGTTYEEAIKLLNMNTKAKGGRVEKDYYNNYNTQRII